MILDLHVRALRTLLDDDLATHEQLIEEVGVGGALEYARLVSSAFVLAVQRQVPPKYGPDDVIRLVAELRSSLPPEHDIDPRVAEQQMRAALGERVTAADGGNSERLEIQMTIVEWLLGQSRLDGRALDEFLQEAREQADRWEAEGLT